MSLEVVIPVKGQRQLQDLRYLENKVIGTVDVQEALTVDSDTTFENMMGTLMKGGVDYRLMSLLVQVSHSEDYVKGTTPVVGFRQVNLSVGVPGNLEDPSGTYEMKKLLLYYNTTTGQWEFEQNDNNSFFEFAWPITGSLAKARYNKDSDLSFHVTDGANASGSDQDATGGLEFTVHIRMMDWKLFTALQNKKKKGN